MVFPIAGGTQSTGYEISNSLRFNDADSPTLQFTPSSAGNEKTWTVSFWVKRGVVTTSSAQMIFCADTNYDEYVFGRFCGTENTNKEDEFQVVLTEPNGRQANVTTTRKFRDPAAWYHIVVRCDTTQSTSTDRLRVYVNGSQETSLRDNSQLNQNDDNINWNSNVPQAIGHQKQASTVERHLDGYLSEFYNIDGTSLGPDSFGETNDNGVWVPKQYTGSFGTNGYFLEFKQTGTSANSSGMGADTSGNDHHWTPANLASTDQTTDTCTNNFCTFSSIAFGGGGLTDYTARLAEGNLVGDTTANTDDFTYLSTFPTNMPFYFEVKFEDVHGSGNDQRAGIVRVEKSSQGGSHAEAHYRRDGTIQSLNAAGNTVATTQTSKEVITDNDIIGIAADNTTNNNVKFYHNGSLQGTIDIVSTETYMPFIRLYGDTSTTRASANFGNPAFAISSGNADANGYGNFEYAVPSGYYALCTKNLAEYG